MDAGLLLPLFSLPSSGGRGDFSQAKHYIDFLKAAGFMYWQILPINPVDRYLSPYASPDLSAGDYGLLDTVSMEKAGFLPPLGVLPFEKKVGALMENLNTKKVERTQGFQDFMNRSEQDTVAAGLFSLAMGRYGEFSYWPTDVKEDYASFHRAHADDPLVRTYAALAFIFEIQWREVLDYAESRGIQIVGDLPYYPGIDSVERWVMPEHFLLDEHLEPLYVSGVPGDDFSDFGQLWNSPVYNWRRMEAENFSYHRKQIGNALGRYHRLRLDHFRGYEKVFHIPRGGAPAEGHWEDVPGEALFRPWKEDPRFFIEDLGHLDVDFYRFRDAFSWPGMKVMALEGPGGEGNRPQIYYTGNHDTDPLPLYVKHMDEDQKRAWEDVLEGEMCVSRLIGYAVHRREDTVFFQHGDFLKDPSRINRPGTCFGNWRWMLPREALLGEAAEEIRNYLEERAK
ncbi:MAG: 4-alpha-glucanotransferase [Peptoniphilus sp.]|nr:4-alpha-glucanotransferase [Peptoniphilus sp.]MDY3118909.1 4-alpha-glucanotransferase [Peptoniphilus sp.]